MWQSNKYCIAKINHQPTFFKIYPTNQKRDCNQFIMLQKFGQCFTGWLDLVHNVLLKCFYLWCNKIALFGAFRKCLNYKANCVSPVISRQINIYLSVFISTFLGLIVSIKEATIRHFKNTIGVPLNICSVFIEKTNWWEISAQ